MSLCGIQQELSRDARQWILSEISKHDILLSGLLWTRVELGGKCGICSVTAVSQDEQEPRGVLLRMV